MSESPVLPAALLFTGLVIGLAVQWIRAVRLPSRRWRAIGNTVGGLVILVVILTDIGGLGASFGALLATMPSFFVLVWAVADLILLVALGVELNRLARTRDGEGRPQAGGMPAPPRVSASAGSTSASPRRPN
jgi:CDP-diglyceride synthetase